MTWSIDPRSPVPAYQQVIQSIKLEILSGRLKDGDQLPPIRELAKILKLNPNTVARAYYALEEEGFVDSKVGSGNWVRAPRGRQDSLRRTLLEDAFRDFMGKAVALGFGKMEVQSLIERFTT